MAIWSFSLFKMAAPNTFNLSNNTFRSKPNGKFDISYHVPLLFIASLIITMNVLVIVLFLKRENLRKAGKLLLFSLAVSDLFTGLLAIPLNIGCEVTFLMPLCAASGMLNRFIAISTIYHILAITFETYYAILRPVQHRVNIEPCKVLGISSGIWLGALLTALAPLYWVPGSMKNVRSKPSADFLRKQTIYEIVVFSAGFLLPLALMVFAHARMFSKIINALNLLRKRASSLRQTPNTSKFKTALLFAVILFLFTLSWSFWFVAGMFRALEKKKYPFPLWAVDSLTVLRYSTSFINPLLYTFFRPDVYQALKSCFKSSRSGGRKQSVTLSNLLSGGKTIKRSSNSNFTSSRDASFGAPRSAAPNPPNDCSKLKVDTRV